MSSLFQRQRLRCFSRSFEEYFVELTVFFSQLEQPMDYSLLSHRRFQDWLPSRLPSQV